MKDFYAECYHCLTLIKKQYQALVVVISAVLLIIIVQSPSIQFIEQVHFASLLMYGLCSVSILWLICRIPFNQLQLGLGDYRFWLPASALYLAIALPLVVLGSQGAAMNNYYQKEAVDWPDYLFVTSIYMLGWEYFYRGFFIAGLRNSLKEGAILIQMIPFTLLHLGKPDAETITCIFSGLAWGYICYRGRSFWPAFFMHLIVNVAAVVTIN